MDKKFNKEEIKTYLRKICSNNQFAKSSLYSNLLTFLVDQALEDAPVKGHTIGAALFDKKYNPVKDDGKVRVYMYNLRKKLKVYYEGVGAEDAIVFSLETGKYTITFKDQKDRKSLNKSDTTKVDKPLSTYLYWYRFATIFLGLGLISSVFFFNYDAIFPKETYCWNVFLEKDARNFMVLADQVILRKKGPLTGNFFTREHVNSRSEYITNSKVQNDSLILTDYTFFTKSIPFSLMRITDLLSNYDTEMALRPESELKYDIIKRSNIIYVGQHKTMSLSKEIFLKNSKMFTYNYESGLFVQEIEEKTIKYYPKFEGNIRMEYAMVSFMPLEDGHKALYFVSDHDIGVMATVEQFVNLDKLVQFYEKLPSKDSYFNALFRVEGLNRLDVNCELVALEVIE